MGRKISLQPGIRKTILDGWSSLTVAARIAVDIPPESAGWVRAQQLTVFQSFAPLIVLANLLNVGLMVGLMFDTGARSIVLGWAVAITALMLVLALRAWHSARRSRRAPAQTRSQRSIGANTRDTAILGIVWALLPALCFSSATPQHQMVIAVVAVGMMCGGAFIMSTVPRAATVFVGLLALGSYVGLLRDPTPLNLFVSGMLTVYASTLLYGVARVHKEFVGRLLSERLARDQADLIGMLLRDFEEAASDWLWTTDATGRPTGGWARFVGDSAAAGHGMTDDFLTFFEPDSQSRELDELMRRDGSFSNHVVRTTVENGARWIALTGKPVRQNGVFAGYKGVASDITGERESVDRIAHLAAHDSLTGLANRSTLRAVLGEVLGYAPARKQASSLLLIDLDRFKVINDTLGHAAGDAVLVEAARRIRAVITGAGLVARMGGDEFAVVINQPGHNAELLARQIIDAIEQPYLIDGSAAKCSASIGLRPVCETDDDMEVLLRQGDLALYRAKAQGRGHVVEFDWTMDLEAQELMLLEHDLRSAIAGEELHLAYQPLADTSTGVIAGCEALLRWEHPRLGNIAPDRFIDLAERSGLIVPVGEWVIRSAIAAAAKIDPHIRVAINVSPMQLRSPNLCAVFINALAANGVAPERIEVEITESVLLADTEANLAVLQQLRALGLRISMDDFGTGYSSFSYLRKFDFDKLKIDKSFIDCLGQEDSSDAIVGAIIALARVLGMRTVAEGVETSAQLDLVRRLGCDEAQGYLFSRPIDLEALVTLVGAVPTMHATGPEAESGQIDAPAAIHLRSAG
tara:strand:+ start:6687 stop:9104 length:2418 start_codon:yes stop_codon:yes gene_type:complete